MLSAIPVERVEARTHKVPTDASEADGTFALDSTTLVMVEVATGGCSDEIHDALSLCLARTR
jgi:hypothetical protein